jgi:hypothetical protein
VREVGVGSKATTSRKSDSRPSTQEVAPPPLHYPVEDEVSSASPANGKRWLLVGHGASFELPPALSARAQSADIETSGTRL